MLCHYYWILWVTRINKGYLWTSFLFVHWSLRNLLLSIKWVRLSVADERSSKAHNWKYSRFSLTELAENYMFNGMRYSFKGQKSDSHSMLVLLSHIYDYRGRSTFCKYGLTDIVEVSPSSRHELNTWDIDLGNIYTVSPKQIRSQ